MESFEVYPRPAVGAGVGSPDQRRRAVQIPECRAGEPGLCDLRGGGGEKTVEGGAGGDRTRMLVSPIAVIYVCE